MSKEPKPKAVNGNGTIERRGKEWWARISLPDGRRKRMPIPNSEKMSEAMAREKAAFYSEKVRKGEIVFDDRTRGAQAAPGGPATTVRQLASSWTSGALFETYGPVNRLRVKASAKIDAWTLDKHVMEVKTRGVGGPAFGDLAITAVTAKDVISVMAAQPKEHRAQTRLHTYQRLRRIFDLAIFPLQLRPEGDNPVSRYLRPSPDVDKEFCYLFPTEFLALLRGTNKEGETVIPLARRVLYALAVYAGFRRESLFTLTWGNLDAENRTLVALKTKTGKPCFAEGDPPSLFVLLAAWHSHCGKPSDGAHIISEGAIGCRKRDLATVLRADLKAVGVTRDLLFSDAPNVEPLRFHDLRATFETWARRQGWPQDRIDRRTGHTSKEMGDRYARAAMTLGELRMAVFPDLTPSVPELAEEAIRLATALAKKWERRTSPVANRIDDPASFKQCEGGDLNPYASYGASTSS